MLLNISNKKKNYLVWLNGLVKKKYLIFVQYAYKDMVNDIFLQQIQSKKKIPYFFFTLMSKLYFKKNYKGNATFMYMFDSFEIFLKFIKEQQIFNILFFVILKNKNNLNLFFYSKFEVKEYMNASIFLLFNLKNLLNFLINNLFGHIGLLFKILYAKLILLK